MRLAAVLLAASVLASPVTAADCKVNFVANNTTAYEVGLMVESRTRANMTWYDGAVAPFFIFAADDRHRYLAPGARIARTARFPIVGCRIKRELRVTQKCYTVNPATNRRTLMTELVLHPWGRGLQTPRDVTLNIKC